MRFLVLAFALAFGVSGCTAKDMDDKDVDVVDIENHSVNLYNQVVYDDGNYSYSLVANYCNTLTKPDSYLPIGKEIANPTYGIEKCRLRLFREDTEECIRDSIVESQLRTIELTNLLNNIAYRCELWSDDEETMIGCDRFRTVGKTRMLKIPALKQINTTAIYNNGYGYIYNVRDLGGLKTYDGKSIRYGRIIRGSALMSSDGLTFLSDEGIIELNKLGISAELDLRMTSLKISPIGNDIDYISVPIDQWFYRLNIYHNQKKQVNAFATAIRYLLNHLRNSGCVYVHCAGGADRTGALCAVIEGLCGVTENEICHDYEMTSFWQLRTRNREYYTISNGAHYDGDYKFAMAYIKGLLEYNGNIYVKSESAYYDTDIPVINYTPQPIDNPILIKNLDNIPKISLKEKFRLLMQIGENGLSIAEMDELEDLLLQTESASIPTNCIINKVWLSKSETRYGMDGRILPAHKKGFYIQSGKYFFK